MTDQDTDDTGRIKKAASLILKDDIKHLQLIPSVALKLLTLTNDDNARIDSLSRIIETEPMLTAKILRQVNSAAYALPNKITSTNRAVTLLGFSTVRQLALNLLIYNNLKRQNPSQLFDLLFFWQHCLYVASLSRRIAVALNYPDPDLVYTGGLLHDIGKVVLETHGRVTYSDFIASIGNNQQSTLEEERNFFGITHAEMGHIFCLEWQLPASITAIVAFHHNQPTEASPHAPFNTAIAIVSFADYIAWIQGIGSATQRNSHPTLQRAVLETIDLDQLNLEALLQQVDQDMQSTQEFYNIQLPSLITLRATLVKATINLSQVSEDNALVAAPKLSSCLTAPHHSLNPDDFIPRTLEAIQDEFSFDRSIMFTIDPKRRCLIASYGWPESTLPTKQPAFEININSLSGLLLTCLREKKAVIIHTKVEQNNPIIQHLKTTEFIAIPVAHQNKLLGVLYADKSLSKKPLREQLLPEITPIAYELGIAIFNAKQYHLEKKNAQIDHLTQLFNKRMINQFLTTIFQEDGAALANIAIGFIDIDKFKRLNDSCGHQAGDDALKIVADILRNLTRPGDFIGRYGGEEFLFVLRNTNETGAYGYAERIRSEIERRGKIMSQRFHGHNLTVSIGVSLYSEHYADYTDMIETADQAMYQAKNSGRNRIVMLTGDGK
ncbi:MAG: HDOD domain-containing protein [Methylobacter sp.]|uniref:diguanylate cyclase n=1 Tax=Candidatus Methylobacter titanis TaxID=3053457 RepID=A0AA43TKW4_9GAMM|nr:HDOD domain-containing protein [Candidatus Methylobacter titanis]